jgi:rare lipoprotein A
MPQGNGPRGSSDEARYDEVGYAGVGAGSAGISAASRALPRGAYAEVTSLDSGRTILVLIADDAAPGNRIVDLSRGAAQLLGVGEGAPVRVRRVDPSPPDQTALAQGQAASPRLDTPPVLLSGLRRKLGVAGAASTTPSRYTPPPATASPPPSAPGASYGAPGAGYAPPAANRGARGVTVRDTVATPSGYFVQIATLSSRDRAVALAGSFGGGSVVQQGNLWRVRIGPYASAAAAQRARDGAAARGYGDARIVHDEQ